MERELAAIRKHDRVPRVVAALVPDHVLHLLAEQVRDLSLTFVPPLGTDEHDRWHAASKDAPGTGRLRRRCALPGMSG